MEKKKKSRMINLCFRTEPDLIDLFYVNCKEKNLTRSEGFRIIFNQHIIHNYLKRQNDVHPRDSIKCATIEEDTHNIKLNSDH